MMELIKFGLILILIIHKSRADWMTIFVKNVDYMVGIFEYNPQKQDQVSYLHQGVLIHPQIVVTSSKDFKQDMNLKVRRYNWQKSFLVYTDRKTTENDFEERLVDESSFQDLIKVDIVTLVLDKAFDNVETIFNENLPSNYLFDKNPKCIFMKIKFQKKEHWCSKPDCQMEVHIKQREVKPHQNEKLYKCSESFLSKFFGQDQKVNADDYFCVEESGKFNCNSYEGSALVCQTREKPKSFFLAGVNIGNDNCKFIFESAIV